MDNLKRMHALYGNCDGHHIRSAMNRLRKFHNMRKILVVISDGQPAYQDGIDDTKRAVQQATHARIKVIGIGIEGATLKTLDEIYPTKYLFEKTANLHTELSNLILSSLQPEKYRLVKNRWEI